MGIGCGLMGGLVVTRRLSLFSDTLSHAVLPGIVVGFILGGFKSSFVVIIGAMVAGFLGVTLISSITKYTKIRLDSALGLVLSGFYAMGVCLLTRIQKLEFGNQSELIVIFLVRLQEFHLQIYTYCNFWGFDFSDHNFILQRVACNWI